MHGARAGQALARVERDAQAAAAREAAVTLGLPRDVHPARALVEAVHMSAGMVGWYAEQARGLGAGEVTAGGRPHPLVVLLGEERDRLVAASSAALKAGVEERQVRLAEGYGTQLSGLIREVLMRVRAAVSEALAGYPEAAAAVGAVWDGAVDAAVVAVLRDALAGGMDGGGV